MVISGEMCRRKGARLKLLRLAGSGGDRLQRLYHRLPLDGACALNGPEAENRFVVTAALWISSSLRSAKDHALLIVATLGAKAVSMPKGVAVVIINSNTSTLVGGSINTRT